MLLAEQLVHQRSALFGPLVLEKTLFKYPRLRQIGVQPVSRRFEPSSRTALIGEQPNPWELLHPQDAMSRHRGAEPRRRYGRLGATSFYLLSFFDTTIESRITKFCFRTCLTHQSRS